MSRLETVGTFSFYFAQKTFVNHNIYIYVLAKAVFISFVLNQKSWLKKTVKSY